MFVSDKLKNYLKDSAMISGNNFYITSLKNVICFTTSSSCEDMDKPLSRELLENLLDFSNKILDSDEPFFFTNEKSKTIPIFEDKHSNIEWNSQIILPIYLDDRLIGSLIMTSYHKTFYDKHITLAKTIESFTEKFILEYLNKLKKGAIDLIWINLN